MDMLRRPGARCGRFECEIRGWLVVDDSRRRGRAGRGNERPRRDTPPILDSQVFQGVAAGLGVTLQSLERSASSKDLGQAFDDSLTVAVEDRAEAFDGLGQRLQVADLECLRRKREHQAAPMSSAGTGVPAELAGAE